MNLKECIEDLKDGHRFVLKEIQGNELSRGAKFRIEAMEYALKILERLEKIKIIEIPKNEKEGKLTPNQIFGAGQMNILLRLRGEEVKECEKKT